MNFYYFLCSIHLLSVDSEFYYKKIITNPNLKQTWALIKKTATQIKENICVERQLISNICGECAGKIV